MPIMLCTHDRCLFGSSPSVWRCCTPLLLARRRSSDPICLGASQLIKGLQWDGSEFRLWHDLTTAVRDRLLGRQLWKRLGRYSEGRREMSGRTGWRAHCQFSSGDTNLASNTTAHQKKTHASSLRLTPLSLPSVTKERGWCRPLPLVGGDAKSSPVSPLSHSWWAWHEKKEKWEPCREREG